MKYLLFILSVIFIITLSSCRKDFDIIKSSGDLIFSKDTVFLDTVFSNISSSTYNFKVYNNGNKDISIPEIILEKGNTSNYRLSVDGITGKEINDIEILAKDSIYIFVEATVKTGNITNPLYTDRILFNSNNTQQHVDLVTLIKDAVFIFPNRTSSVVDKLVLDGEQTDIKGRFLTDSELTFTKDKPYIIYGYAAVPSGKTLSIEAGAEIYFHNDSGLIIDNGATLEVNGTKDEKVIFEGDRLEPEFENSAGQWGTIWIKEGSENNSISNAQIKNAVVGILVEGTDPMTNSTLKIDNTEIYNSSTFGIYTKKSNIEGSNIVIGNSGQSCLSAKIGGTYNFTHSTFANFWSFGLRSSPTINVSNFETTYDESGNEYTVKKETQLNLTNCIIEGNNINELILNKIKGTTFDYTFKNCLIRHQKLDNELDFNDTSHFQNIILNGNPNFKDTSLNKFIIGEKSDAIKKATSSSITNDILGVNRSTTPDIGAYQHITFE